MKLSEYKNRYIGPTKNTKLHYYSNIDSTIDETRRRVQNDYRVKSTQYWKLETDNIDSGFIQDSYGINTLLWRYWSIFAKKRRRLQNDYWNMMAQLCRSKNYGIYSLLWHYWLLVGPMLLMHPTSNECRENIGRTLWNMGEYGHDCQYCHNVLAGIRSHNGPIFSLDYCLS